MAIDFRMLYGRATTRPPLDFVRGCAASFAIDDAKLVDQLRSLEVATREEERSWNNFGTFRGKDWRPQEP
jgi:hypothetical protein